MFECQVRGDKVPAPKPEDRRFQNKRKKYRCPGPAVSPRARTTFKLGTVEEYERSVRGTQAAVPSVEGGPAGAVMRDYSGHRGHCSSV